MPGGLGAFWPFRSQYRIHSFVDLLRVQVRTGHPDVWASNTVLFPGCQQVTTNVSLRFICFFGKVANLVLCSLSALVSCPGECTAQSTFSDTST